MHKVTGPFIQTNSWRDTPTTLPQGRKDVTQTIRLGRAFVALGLTVALLVSCAQPTTPVTTAPPVTPPADAPTALVHGVAGGPVYEKLKERVRMTVHDGSQEVIDFDMVIFDGDGFTGQQLAQDELIAEAVHSGVWVSGLDLAADHKNGLGRIIGGWTPSPGLTYMVRQSRRSDESLLYTLVEPAAGLEDASQLAQQMLDHVKNLAPSAQNNLAATQDDPTAPIPPRLINVTYRLVKQYDPLLPENMNPVFNGTYPLCKPGNLWGCSFLPAQPQQQASWAVVHQVQIFLDATDNPQGNFQHVLVTSDGDASPGPPVSNTKDSCSQYGDQCELAWIQTRFDNVKSFPPDPDSGLVVQQSSPANVNKEETVTTGSSFNVGYNQQQGVFGSYSYSNSVMKTITDWQALNDSTSNTGSWAFASNNPYNGLTSSGYDSSMWFYYGGVAPQTPNTLAQANFQYETQTYWVNSSVSDAVLVLNGTDTAYYNDTWVVTTQSDNNPNGDNPFCTPILCGMTTQHYYQYKFGEAWALNIDMSTVIPVPTKSLTFSPNPVVAGNSTTATLTLQSKTPLDAQILVTSDTSGVAPDNDTYTIPAGQDSFSFTVNTGAQGCQPQSATIQAYYAEGQNGVLTVSPPSPCSARGTEPP